jgi:hypothetical protein
MEGVADCLICSLGFMPIATGDGSPEGLNAQSIGALPFGLLRLPLSVDLFSLSLS